MSASIKTMQGRPVIPVFATGRLSDGMQDAIFWCAHCRTWHLHGVSEDARTWPGEHRTPHCWRRPGPYEEHGYFIWLIADLPRWARDRSGFPKHRLTAKDVLRLAEDAKPASDAAKDELHHD